MFACAQKFFRSRKHAVCIKLVVFAKARQGSWWKIDLLFKFVYFEFEAFAFNEGSNLNCNFLWKNQFPCFQRIFVKFLIFFTSFFVLFFFYFPQISLTCFQFFVILKFEKLKKNLNLSRNIFPKIKFLKIFTSFFPSISNGRLQPLKTCDICALASCVFAHSRIKIDRKN